MASLKEGAVVRVKEGVQCPGYEEIDIGGWQGRVEQGSKTEE